jgi:hypothetical protein
MAVKQTITLKNTSTAFDRVFLGKLVDALTALEPEAATMIHTIAECGARIAAVLPKDRTKPIEIFFDSGLLACSSGEVTHLPKNIGWFSLDSDEINNDTSQGVIFKQIAEVLPRYLKKKSGDSPHFRRWMLIVY